jgi:hypothetical protein
MEHGEMTTPKATVTREHRELAAKVLWPQLSEYDLSLQLQTDSMWEQRERMAQALADTEQQALASRPAPEQVPTGEVTREHQLAAHDFLRLSVGGTSMVDEHTLSWLLARRDAAAYAKGFSDAAPRDAYARGRADGLADLGGKAEAARGESEARELAAQVVHLLEGAKLIPSAYDRLPRVFELIRAIGLPGDPPSLPQPEAQRDATEGALRAELLKHQDLVEALQWLPVGTVVDFCDLDDFLEELRRDGWRPRRECSHVFIGTNNCAHCGIDVDDLEVPAPPPAAAKGGL